MTKSFANAVFKAFLTSLLCVAADTSVAFADAVSDLTAKQSADSKDLLQSYNRRIEEAGEKFGAAYLKNMNDGTTSYQKELDALHQVQGEGAKAVQENQIKQNGEWAAGEMKRVAESVSKSRGVAVDLAAAQAEIERKKNEVPSSNPAVNKTTGAANMAPPPYMGPLAPGRSPASVVPPSTGYSQPASSGYVQPASTNSWGGSSIGASEGIDGSGIAKDLDFPSTKSKPAPKK